MNFFKISQAIFRKSRMKTINLDQKRKIIKSQWNFDTNYHQLQLFLLFAGTMVATFHLEITWIW